MQLPYDHGHDGPLHIVELAVILNMLEKNIFKKTTTQKIKMMSNTVPTKKPGVNSGAR